MHMHKRMGRISREVIILGTRVHLKLNFQSIRRAAFSPIQVSKELFEGQHEPNQEENLHRIKGRYHSLTGQSRECAFVAKGTAKQDADKNASAKPLCYKSSELGHVSWTSPQKEQSGRSANRAACLRSLSVPPLPLLLDRIRKP